MASTSAGHGQPYSRPAANPSGTRQAAEGENAKIEEVK